MHDGNIESHFTVLFFQEMAESNKGIHVLACSFQQSGMSPQLGRPLMRQGTEEAISLRADRTVEFVQHMSRANQPVLMHSVQLDTLPIFQYFRPADQRDVMIVDDIKPFFQNLPDLIRFKERVTCLLGGKGRKKAETTLEPVHGHIRVIVVGFFGVPPRQEAVRVNAVDDVDPMPPLCQLIG